MKISSPWDTSIIDLVVEPEHRSLVKLWIWIDRAIWVCVTVVTYSVISSLTQ